MKTVGHIRSSFFKKKTYLLIWERESVYMSGGKGKKERERISSRLLLSMQPEAGLDPTILKS